MSDALLSGKPVQYSVARSICVPQIVKLHDPSDSILPSLPHPCMAQTFRSVRFDQLTILVGKMQFSLSHSQLLVMGWV
jgi:hypothetical protein